MTSQTKKILLFGATGKWPSSSAKAFLSSFVRVTGYIGGSVLNRLLEHEKASTFSITVPVRSSEKAKMLESKFEVQAEIASLSDHEKLESLASNADIVIHTVRAAPGTYYWYTALTAVLMRR